jgi:hypothetical protein
MSKKEKKVIKVCHNKLKSKGGNKHYEKRYNL